MVTMEIVSNIINYIYVTIYMLPAPHTYMYNACTNSSRHTQVHAVHFYEHDNDIYGNHSYHASMYSEIFHGTAKQKATMNITTVHAICVG